jgi:hypothetical protein
VNFLNCYFDISKVSMLSGLPTRRVHIKVGFYGLM